MGSRWVALTTDCTEYSHEAEKLAACVVLHCPVFPQTEACDSEHCLWGHRAIRLWDMCPSQVKMTSVFPSR